MKKNLLWMMLLVMIGGFSFVACSDDDDDTPSVKSLIGVWADNENPYSLDYVKSKAGSTVPKDAAYCSYYYVFDEDNSIYYFMVYTNEYGKVIGNDYVAGVYELNGNTLTYQFDDDDDSQTCKVSLSKKSLKMYGESWEENYTRIATEEFSKMIGLDV